MDSSSLHRNYESMQANGVVHGVKWMSAGNDGMVKVGSLHYLLLCFV